MLLEKLLGRLAALADSLTAERIPSTALLQDAHFASEIDDFAVTGYSRPIEYIEFRFLERRGHLVLNDFDPGATADDIITVFKRADAPDIHANRSVKFKGVTSRRRLGVAEHHTDLHANLVDKDDHRLGAGNGPGQFTQGL